MRWIRQRVRKECARTAAGQEPFEFLSKRHRNRPVVPRLAGRSDRRPHPADAAFAVGHCAGLFAPGGGGQQQVGIVAAGRGGKGLLHDHQLSTLQRAAHRRLVGHGLGRVGAGNPECLDLAVGGGLKHLDGGLARFFGNRRHAPERGDFRAVRRVGQIAVGTQ